VLAQHVSGGDPILSDLERIIAARQFLDQIDPSRLPEMMKHTRWAVRLWVVERIDPSRLLEMMEDPRWRVRCEVSKRIPCRFLSYLLMREANPKVRESLESRIMTPSNPSFGVLSR